MQFLQKVYVDANSFRISKELPEILQNSRKQHPFTKSIKTKEESLLSCENVVLPFPMRSTTKTCPTFPVTQNDAAALFAQNVRRERGASYLFLRDFNFASAVFHLPY